MTVENIVAWKNLQNSSIHYPYTIYGVSKAEIEVEIEVEIENSKQSQLAVNEIESRQFYSEQICVICVRKNLTTHLNGWFKTPITIEF